MRTKKGIVTSDKMNNTVIVSVDTDKKHAKYFKRFTQTKKFYADTNGKEVKLNDTVEIVETRPLSKQKRWKVINVISK